MSPKRVLIVEDTMGIARPLERAISLSQENNIWVEICAAAEPALEMLSEQHYDLLITDLRLPGMSGLELLELVHQKPNAPHLIMITAYGNAEVEARLHKLGAAYLPKPFRLRELTETANRLLADVQRPGLDSSTFADAAPPLQYAAAERRRATHFKVLATDLDGTLMHNGVIQARTWSVLRQLKLGGLTLILATGRPLEFFIDQGPFNELFEAIVAEDGAVVYFPRRDAVRLPFGRVPPTIVQRLEELKVPLERGMSIVATRIPHDQTVLRVLQESGTGMTIEYNRGAVMLLPPGATKGTGLNYALQELGYSARNVVACGDAENERSLFEMAELAVAVANAPQQVKAMADTVLPEDGPDPSAGFEKFVGELLNRRQPVYRQRPERRLVLGYARDNAPVYLDPLMLVDSRIGIFGASSSGKSWLAGLITEELFKKGYQVCIIDPEGDYRGLATSTRSLLINVTEEHTPAITELINFSEWHGVSMVVDLSTYPVEARPEFLCELLLALRGLRMRRGRPHWLLVDEVQGFCPPEGSEFTDLLLESMHDGLGIGMVSYRPSLVAPQLLAMLDHYLMTRLNLEEEIVVLRPYMQRYTVSEEILAQIAHTPNGQAYLCSQAFRPLTANLEGPVRFRPGPRTVPHSRHLHKYLRAALPPYRRFYFCDASGEQNGRVAANLWEFSEMLKLLTAGSLEYHLARGDFQRWLADVLRDDELARRVQKLEARGLKGAELQSELIEIVHNRYEELENLL